MKDDRKMSQVARLWLQLLVAVVLLCDGCQTSRQSPSYSRVPEESRDEGLPHNTRLVRGEMISIRLPDSGFHDYRIKEDGTVTLPLIGAVEAAGKTPEELQRVIHDLYVPRYYKSLSFSVPRRVYYVNGQVRAPGRQEYIGPTTVLKAIVSAGDFTEYAARRHIVLTRVDGKRFLVNYIKAAKEPSLDLPIYPGDKIEVPLTTPPSVWRIIESR